MLPVWWPGPAVLPIALVALEFLAVARVLKHFLVGHHVTLLEGPASSFLGNEFRKRCISSFISLYTGASGARSGVYAISSFNA